MWHFRMNNNKYIASALLVVFASCVQPAFQQQLNFRVKVPAGHKTVGVRGSDRPLNWQNDLALSPASGDTLWQGTTTIFTGYLFTEIKFTLDGDFEPGEGNRVVTFDASQVTQVDAEVTR
jgi:hypothetical protein